MSAVFTTGTGQAFGLRLEVPTSHTGVASINFLRKFGPRSPSMPILGGQGDGGSRNWVPAPRWETWLQTSASSFDPGAAQLL